MAKTKQIKRKSSKRSEDHDLISRFDLDAFTDKYIWLLFPLLILLYFWFSAGSTGFYQDDEIGHYRNIRQFWGDPFSIMGNQPKPGWKILLVVPGLFGFTGVALAHCAIAALTVVMTYKLGRAIKIKNATMAAVFLAAQPLYLQISFRAYSEITAALFLVLSLYFYYRERWIWAALASSYVFAIRQEFALVSLGLGVIFLLRRQWLPFLLLAWTPAVLAVIGWLSTGNPAWLLDDMLRIGLGVEVPHKPFWHYFETYVYMVGPVILTLLILGYWKHFLPVDSAREQIRRHGFLFFTFTIMFAWAVFSAWDVPDFGANPGHWRYLLSIAPLTAIYATMGMNSLFEAKNRTIGLSLLGVAALIGVLFLARDTNGLILVDQPRWDHVGMMIAVLGIAAAFAGARMLSGPVFVSTLLVATVVFTVYAEKPRELDNEARTVRQAAEWYLEQPAEFQQRPLYGNHVLFRYFADIDINDTNRDRSMQRETLAQAPRGSVVIWDSHYGNSQFGGDVPMEFFQENPAYKVLEQFVAADQTFGILVFEKLAGSRQNARTQEELPANQDESTE
ncbi:MAG: hypothetical protein RRA94_07355 [Bacteroidota bacterium]|nr:hypothetical protein [Bacteroidota bacterium]